MSPFLKYIANEQHYTEVLSKLTNVKRTLWIGTADIKDLYIKQGNDVVCLPTLYMTLNGF